MVLFVKAAISGCLFSCNKVGFFVFNLTRAQCIRKITFRMLQPLFALKHKPQRFFRVCVRFECLGCVCPFKRRVYRRIEVQTRCYFGRNSHVLTWEIIHFIDSKYHVVSFIFTDFNVDRDV